MYTILNQTRKEDFWKVVSMQSEFRSERLYEELTIDNVELRYDRQKIVKNLSRDGEFERNIYTCTRQ
jgi:hypothetical protein